MRSFTLHAHAHPFSATMNPATLTALPLDTPFPVRTTYECSSLKCPLQWSRSHVILGSNEAHTSRAHGYTSFKHRAVSFRMVGDLDCSEHEQPRDQENLESAIPIPSGDDDWHLKLGLAKEEMRFNSAAPKDKRVREGIQQRLFNTIVTDSVGEERNEKDAGLDFEQKNGWIAMGKPKHDEPKVRKDTEEQPEDYDDEYDAQITRISVQRQRYIPISKVGLVTSLRDLFTNNEEASEFLSVCSCLEAILHAEHKRLLEEIRLDYRLTRSPIEEIRHNGLFFKETIGSVPKSVKTSAKRKKTRASLFGKNTVNGSIDARYNNSNVTANRQNGDSAELPQIRGKIEDVRPSETGNGSNWTLPPKSHLPSSDNKANEYDAGIRRNSVAAAARFQHNFMQLLKNAQFQGLSAHDLQLTSALNSDYLLTLPIDVDWKRASSANAIIFRRGYEAERQEGFLFGAKLDYLQSLLLRGIFNWMSKPLFQVGLWVNQTWKQSAENSKSKTWTEGIREWLKEPLKPDGENDLLSPKGGQDFVIAGPFLDGKVNDLPIRIAAQQAVPRYETFLSSAGSRGMLLRKILVWMHLLPSEISNRRDTVESDSASEPHLRQKHLMRISMRDIWLPASKTVCGNNLWRKLQATFSVFFSRSTLQEPAFKELVLLYNAPKSSNGDAQADGIPNLELKIYKRIPIPDLKVIFPNKKLSFRILDMVRLDIATIVGLLAFLVNYRFDNFLSSPSAFLLDIIASSALIVYVTRVVLGYKQTWDRYQLLVNKTLYEKTLASEFGAVHFLVDASEQQKFKESILAYVILLQAENDQVFTRKMLADKCERYLYSCFNEQIEMPIDDALKVLLRLGLVVEATSVSSSVEDINDRDIILKAVPCAQSYGSLQEQWDSLLFNQSVWSANQLSM